MNPTIKWIIIEVFPRLIYKHVINEEFLKEEFINKDFNINGQKAEDLLIEAFVDRDKQGFYIDLGANDPVRFNNTKRFYDKGWNGINVEPNPMKFELFEKRRTRDINLNVGVSSEDNELEFYMFEDDVSNTFDRKIAEKRKKTNKLLNKKKIKVVKLSNILEEYVKDKEIDFMSIDVEGHELDVIKGNDWNKYRPKLVVIELFFEIEQIIKSMEDKGYVMVYFNGLNGFFLDNTKRNKNFYKTEGG